MVREDRPLVLRRVESTGKAQAGGQGSDGFSKALAIEAEIEGLLDRHRRELLERQLDDYVREREARRSVPACPSDPPRRR